MCYAKPGPRCTNHARKKLESSYFSHNNQDVLDAQDEYDETKGGQKELELLIFSASSQSQINKVAQLDARKEAALQRRNVKIGRYKNLLSDELEKYTEIHSANEYYYAKDSDSEMTELNPGELDDESEYLYMNGQCIALAAEISRSTGCDVMMVLFNRERSDDWNEEEAPQEIEKDSVYDANKTGIVHALAVTSDGSFLDVLGKKDAKMYEDYMIQEGNFLVRVPHEDVMSGKFDEDWKDFLSSQNYTLASSFVSPVLEGREADFIQ